MKGMLFRLWIVFTVLWAGYFGYIGYVDYRNAESEKLESESWTNSATNFARTEEARAIAFNAASNASTRNRRHMDAFASKVQYGLAVPLALLALFPICAFIVGGRKKE